MPLSKDHSKLKPASPAEGAKPSTPVWSPIVAEAWLQVYEEDEVDRHQDSPGQLRCSQAGMCSRALAYGLAGLEESNPKTIADSWRFGVGTTIHDKVQYTLGQFMDDQPRTDIEFEVDVDLAEGLISGHVDAVAETNLSLGEGEDAVIVKTVLEIKSINGFGFKQAIGARGAAEGPRLSALMQASLYGLALDADEIVILYLSTENLSPREAKKIAADEAGRFSAEWRMDRETYLPIAIAERDRMLQIISIMDHAKEPSLVDRVIPGLPEGSVIVNPMTGQWVQTDPEGNILDTNTTWQCAYCSFQKQCASDALKEE